MSIAQGVRLARRFWRRKGWSLAASLVLNAGLVWCVLTPRWTVPGEAAAGVSVVEASISASNRASAPRPASAPSPQTETPLEAPEAAPPLPHWQVSAEAKLEAELALEGIAEARRCDLAGALRAVLQANAEVVDAVALMPRAAGSAANAVMLWDGAWLSSVAAAPGHGDVVESAVGDLVRAASPECRATAMIGPQFVFLDDARGGTILVIGSGEWRWDDLIQSAES
jgi:hypothetical protein